MGIGGVAKLGASVVSLVMGSGLIIAAIVGAWPISARDAAAEHKQIRAEISEVRSVIGAELKIMSGTLQKIERRQFAECIRSGRSFEECENLHIITK